MDNDKSILTLEKTERLMACNAKTKEPLLLPTQEELVTVAAHVVSGVSNDLFDEASKHLIALHDIPHLHERLDLHQMRLNFDQTVAQITDHCSTLTTALRHVKSSERLAALMMVVLKMGNILNDGTERGNACGFRVDSLPALSLVKGQSQDPKKSGNAALTGIGYVVKVLSKQRPELLQVSEELRDIMPAVRIDFEEVKRNVGGLRGELQRLGCKLGLLPKEGGSPSADEAVAALPGALEFMEKAMDKIVELENKAIEVKQAYEEATAFFGEEVAAPPHEWLGYIHEFLIELKKAHEVTRVRDKNLRKVSPCRHHLQPGWHDHSERYHHLSSCVVVPPAGGGK